MRERTLNAVPRAILEFIAILGIITGFSWKAIRYPNLPYEDGALLLSRYFNSTDFRSIFHFYAGYLSLFSNLVAWVATRGPVTAAPYVFICSALMLAAVSIFLLTREAWAWLVADRVDRMTCAIVICCLPLARGLMVTSLCYSQWSLLFLLVVLLARRLPDRGLALAAYLFTVLLAIFSNPVSIIILPICLIHFCMEKRPLQRWLAAGLGGAAIVYQVTCVDHGVPVHPTLHACGLALELFLARVVFEAAAGPKTTAILMFSQGSSYVQMCGVAGLSLACVGFLQNRASWRWKAAAGLGLAIAAGVVLMSATVRLVGYTEARLLTPYLQRYFYLPKMILMVLLLSLLVPLLRRSAMAWRWPARAFLLLGVGIYLFAVNQDNALLSETSSRPQSDQLSRFLAEVRRNVREAQTGGAYVSEWSIVRESPWSIGLSVDAHLGRRDASKIADPFSSQP